MMIIKVFFFDAAACGTTNDLNTEDDGLKNDGIVKFSAYLQSEFETDTGSVLTNTEMLETQILCQYKDSIEGIAVAINTDLDNVEADQKVTNDAEEKEIDSGEVGTSIKVNGDSYDPESDGAEAITLGSQVVIEFTEIGELTSGYYIDSCTAKDSNEDNDNFEVKLIESGCVKKTGDNIASINPKILDDADKVTTEGGTKLQFNQFAFVNGGTATNPALEFQLSCVLKFGKTPTCSIEGGGVRRRRSVASQYTGSGVTDVELDYSVAVGEAYTNNKGVVFAAERSEDTESGATEMLVSAYAAAAFLLL